MTRTELSFRLFWYEPDREWVGVCEQFPSLSHLDASPSAALAGIQALVDDVMADLRENGEPMPWEVRGEPPRKVATG